VSVARNFEIGREATSDIHNGKINDFIECNACINISTQKNDSQIKTVDFIELININIDLIIIIFFFFYS